MSWVHIEKQEAKDLKSHLLQRKNRTKRKNLSCAMFVNSVKMFLKDKNGSKLVLYNTSQKCSNIYIALRFLCILVSLVCGGKKNSQSFRTVEVDLVFVFSFAHIHSSGVTMSHKLQNWLLRKRDEENVIILIKDFSEIIQMVLLIMNILSDKFCHHSRVKLKSFLKLITRYSEAHI